MLLVFGCVDAVVVLLLDVFGFGVEVLCGDAN